MPFPPELDPAELSFELPAYAPALTSFHRAYWKELGTVIDDLAIDPGDAILDVACGDGTYARLLHDRIRPATIEGIDYDQRFLEFAAKLTAGCESVTLRRCDALRLPYADASFDFVWCAQSLYSLPEPLAVLKEMCRVTRSGGRVGVLENDTLHHLLMPWPVDLEIALRQAEYEAYGDEGDDPRRYYVARNLARVARRSGLVRPVVRTYAHNRQPPFSHDELRFFGWYFENLRDRIEPFLAPRLLDRLSQLIGEQADGPLFTSPDTVITCLDHVLVAVKE